MNSLVYDIWYWPWVQESRWKCQQQPTCKRPCLQKRPSRQRRWVAILCRRRSGPVRHTWVPRWSKCIWVPNGAPTRWESPSRGRRACSWSCRRRRRWCSRSTTWIHRHRSSVDDARKRAWPAWRQTPRNNDPVRRLCPLRSRRESIGPVLRWLCWRSRWWMIHGCLGNHRPSPAVSCCSPTWPPDRKSPDLFKYFENSIRYDTLTSRY